MIIMVPEVWNANKETETMFFLKNQMKILELESTVNSPFTRARAPSTQAKLLFTLIEVRVERNEMENSKAIESDLGGGNAIHQSTSEKRD